MRISLLRSGSAIVAFAATFVFMPMGVAQESSSSDAGGATRAAQDFENLSVTQHSVRIGGEVLEYTGHETDELREAVAQQLSERKAQKLISGDDEHEVLATISLALDDYTYLT